MVNNGPLAVFEFYNEVNLSVARQGYIYAIDNEPLIGTYLNRYNLGNVGGIKGAFLIGITVRDSVLTNIVLLKYFCGQKRHMGYNKSLSAAYSDAWERYKHHCEHEGVIALNRFCEGEGINVQRLYEWLRRRKISISDYQAGLSGTPAGARNHEEALFREVRLPRPSQAREYAVTGTADVVRDIRIELGGGTVVSLGEIGVGSLATLIEVLARRDDVGA